MFRFGATPLSVAPDDSCALSAHVDAAGQKQNQQHDDEYPSPNRHAFLLRISLRLLESSTRNAALLNAAPTSL